MRRYKIAQKVGRRIRLARKRKDMTQEELSYKVKIHVSTLGRIERGEINAPIQTLDKISRGLGVKPKDLLS